MFAKTRDQIAEKMTEPVKQVAFLLSLIALGVYLNAIILLVRGH